MKISKLKFVFINFNLSSTKLFSQSIITLITKNLTMFIKFA